MVTFADFVIEILTAAGYAAYGFVAERYFQFVFDYFAYALDGEAFGADLMDHG